MSTSGFDLRALSTGFFLLFLCAVSSSPAAENAPKDKESSAQSSPPLTGPGSASGVYRYGVRFSDEPMVNEKLAQALTEAARVAGDAAKKVGRNLFEKWKEKQRSDRRQELVARFYFTLGHLIRPLDLAPDEYRSLVRRVEQYYIEDGQSGKYSLDPVYFSEMPEIVRMEYAEILLKRTAEGTVDTYYLSGARKTRWQLRGNQPHGLITTYDEEGNILYADRYEYGERILRRKYDREGRLVFEENYALVPPPAQDALAAAEPAE